MKGALTLLLLPADLSIPESSDGVSTRWSFAGADSASARQRLARLKGRPQLICSESPVAGVR